ncbi:MAG: F0F1 ATP synthase subunit B [Gammaproteobacteria bacterium]|jgi:F-type H+-transporting ATPase subunit b
MNINLTLIGQMISFAVFVWFSMKFVWPPIVKAIEERQAKIADGLAAAERGVREQELAEQRATEKLHAAKQQAAEIVARAEKRAAEIVEDAKGLARVEGERLIEGARSEIEQETNKARESLRTRVGELALAGAERILRKEIDADAHKDIVDDLAAQL